jgi:Flp pilus assembly protein TadD
VEQHAFDRARAHLARHEYARAKDAFLTAMFDDRHNLQGMLGLSEAFCGLEEYRPASVVLRQAVAHHPDSSDAHSALGGVLLELDDLDGARLSFEAALRLAPALRKPWAGLGVVFERLGDVERADAAWRNAFRSGGPAVRAYRGDGDPLRVLVLQSAVGGNIPLDPVFDDRVFQTITLFVESFHETMVLPEHDVVFNGVGNADLRVRALDMAERVVRSTPIPVINPPSRVRHTGRAEVADRLRALPGIVTPRMGTFDKQRLVDDAGLGWPLLVRALGFHGGEHFAKADDSTQLAGALETLACDEVLAIQYVETCGSDGMYRKYRMLAIGGQLFPAHLAVSHAWKVHYFSAEHGGALDREEEAFLTDPQAVIGDDALRALQAAVALLALDYVGFDFGLDALGRPVIFEANATMRIGSNTPAIDAVRSMIAERAAPSRRL